MTAPITLPHGFDWRDWVQRWERMQEGYLVQRAERFARIAFLLRETRPEPGVALRVLDLGCGPGSLTTYLLDALPQAQMVGVDFDPTLLALAEASLARFGGRARLVYANLREAGWPERLAGPFDAAVSATALHWLPPEHLRDLYGRVARLLRPGGLFLNADHVGSESPAIQRAWEAHREEMRSRERQSAAGEAPIYDWGAFWQAYGRASGLDVEAIHRQMSGDTADGPEEGMPLAWHLDALRAQGFRAADCFWRCDCDAIYGGVR